MELNAVYTVNTSIALIIARLYLFVFVYPSGFVLHPVMVVCMSACVWYIASSPYHCFSEFSNTKLE